MAKRHPRYKANHTRPIQCRLNAEYDTTRKSKKLREKWTIEDYRERAERMALNEQQVFSFGYSHIIRRMQKRDQCLYMRLTRNAWNEYLRRRQL